MKNQNKTWLITGCSTGLGRAKEVTPLDIKVIVVNPGAFRTDFAGRSLTGAATEISDYKDTAGKRRKENDRTHGIEPGNPQKAAQAIIKVAENKKAPFRLLLGTDAIKIILEELDAQSKELEDWKEISITTDY